MTQGRIAALLELGAGLNPEFTGRENVVFYGTMLGMRPDEVRARYEEIVDFAELGSAIERPVRTYSTGMFVRLAFAVAIAVSPDILIVDEALAVGDVYFQQKCFDRIRELRQRGTTLLLVSHDSTAIYRFCDRAVLLESGQLKLDGDPRAVIELYESVLIRERDEHNAHEARLADAVEAGLLVEPHGEPLAPPPTVAVLESRIDDSSVALHSFELRSALGSPVHTVISGETGTIRIQLEVREPLKDPHVGFKLRDRLGVVIYETNTYCMGRSIGPVWPGDTIIVCFTCALPIVDGEYTFHLGVAEGGVGEASFERQLIYAHNIADVQVLRDQQAGIWSGIVDLAPDISIAVESKVL